MSTKVVKSFRAKGIYVGRIDHGQDILTSLEIFCLDNDITTAWVNLMGALSEVTLAYYEQEGHTYVTKTFTGEYEILNGTGNISMRENVPVGHVHLTLSDTNFNCFGGHLTKGSSKVFACEFVLYALEGPEPLFRGHDDITGLPLWIY